MNAAADPNAKRCVLVVDDTPENLLVANEILRDTYTVRVANNGARALKIVEGEQPPDLVLLDVMMPGIDGYEVCRRIKADPRTRHIPVILLTAMTHVEDKKLGLDLGASDYITKPISPTILLDRVKAHLPAAAAPQP